MLIDLAKRLVLAAAACLVASACLAQPVTTKPNTSNTITQCSANVPLVGNGSGTSPICDASGALGAVAFLGTVGFANGGCNATTQTGCINNTHVTPTRAGDLEYWNGTAWVNLPGNNSGTQLLQETSAGVPSWVTVSGTGTVTSVTCFGTAITTSGTCITAGQIPGEPSNGTASAGNVGEYISSVIVAGSATSLTDATNKNVTSISLTAGDWDVTGGFGFLLGASTSVLYLEGSISQTSVTLDQQPDRAFATAYGSGQVLGASANQVFGLSTVRISLASTTTIFLVAQAHFTTSTVSAFGTIRARRAR